MKNQNYSKRDRLGSFRCAFSGLQAVVYGECNARIHLVATLLVIAAGGLLDISRLEWVAVALSVGGVWSMEILNTAIEALADVVQPQQDPRIGRLKDMAAAAVMVSAGIAVVVGMLVFLPPLWHLLQSWQGSYTVPQSR